MRGGPRRRSRTHSLHLPHCTSLTAPTHCTHSLHPLTALTHCTHSLHPLTAPTHCTHSLHSLTALTRCTRAGMWRVPRASSLPSSTCCSAGLGRRRWSHSNYTIVHSNYTITHYNTLVHLEQVERWFKIAKTPRLWSSEQAAGLSAVPPEVLPRSLSLSAVLPPRSLSLSAMLRAALAVGTFWPLHRTQGGHRALLTTAPRTDVRDSLQAARGQRGVRAGPGGSGSGSHAFPSPSPSPSPSPPLTGATVRAAVCCRCLRRAALPQGVVLRAVGPLLEVSPSFAIHDS